MMMTKELRRKARLWPTLMVAVELFPWHWKIMPWGYIRITGGLSFYLEWLGLTVHFGCTVTPRVARKLKEASEDTDN